MEEEEIRQKIIKSLDVYLHSDKARSLKTVFYLALDVPTADYLLNALKRYDFLKRSLNRNWVEIIDDERKIRALEIIKSEFEISFDDKNQTINFQSVERPFTYIRFSLTRKIVDKEKYELLKEQLQK